MRTKLPVTDALMLALVFFFLIPSPAQAYFDLGMGTYMLQILFGFAAAFWFSFKNSWLKKGKHSENSSPEPECSADDEPQPPAQSDSNKS